MTRMKRKRKKEKKRALMLIIIVCFGGLEKIDFENVGSEIFHRF